MIAPWLIQHKPTLYLTQFSISIFRNQCSNKKLLILEIHPKIKDVPFYDPPLLRIFMLNLSRADASVRLSILHRLSRHGEFTTVWNSGSSKVIRKQKEQKTYLVWGVCESSGRRGFKECVILEELVCVIRWSGPTRNFFSSEHDKFKNLLSWKKELLLIKWGFDVGKV